ncbi:hypothetical protein [Brumimicrobium oceani]|uniref:DUF2262 domain-containing protein n=1 Tax=Brumimicrobium oceani TaxID=2100725 RepID=A0A2U2XHF5_9FLAO|nr:hypothetical protein [Brumimicrobium oceani]PWH87229.1 hypothetical protein DIT68_02900 [Brumimicrobium oceani]
MGIFKNIFRKKELMITDTELGPLKSYRNKGTKVLWKTKRSFLGSSVEILIHGNHSKLETNQKRILLEALNNEDLIRNQTEKLLIQQFEHSVMNFTSIKELYDVLEIETNNKGFELTLQEKDGQFRFFTFCFKNGKKTELKIEEY